MIWLTWRQFRVSASAVLGVLMGGVLVVAVTGPQLSSLLRASGQGFFTQVHADAVKQAVFYAGTAAVYAVPAVLGVFWGAPAVARELEAGTHRLVWNQSITRTQWLATKLGVLGTAAALAGLSGLALTWWCAPLDAAVSRGYTDPGLLSVPRLWPQLFGARGTVPIGMAVLALVTGVTVGMFLRRTVAAMATTLVLVVGVQVAAPLLVQPLLLPAQRTLVTITQDNLREVQATGLETAADMRIVKIGVSVGRPGAWITENRTVDPSGRPVGTFPAWTTACAPPPDVPTSRESVDACFTRLADEGYRQQVAYQPASRFWLLQLLETGLLLGAAALLAGVCFWRIRRDLT